MQEVFKQFRNSIYQVSNLGRIYSTKTNKVLCQQINRGGYKVVGLYIDGVSKKYKVHRLVAETFHKKSKNKIFVNHIDGDKQNNKASNLEWVTPSRNTKHAYDMGLAVSKKGTQVHTCRLTETQVKQIKSSFMTIKELSNIYGVGRTTISDIKNNKTWRHL